MEDPTGELLCACPHKSPAPLTLFTEPELIHSVDSSAKPFKWCTVELDGMRLPLLLEMAASRSLLNKSTVWRLFPQTDDTDDRRALYGRPSIGHGPSSSVLSMRQEDRAKRGMKQRFDRKHRVKGPTLMMSDWVRIMQPHRSHKPLLFWSAPQQMAPSGMLAG
ncbi:hypothetical protein CRENBAI_014215 [Crenichthys baileyi]|uniref:Uncharacterized protein n=1 Tax=Crenichthys baileyi TaxID=28760 RepID=A0AAV9QUV3_9TELE